MGEKEPENTVNGPHGFGYYNPVVWEDAQHHARWARVRSAHPNDGRHGWNEDSYRFSKLRPCTYRVTAMMYRQGDKCPDPTPYGVSEPFTLGAESETPSVEISLGGSAPLVIRFVDAQSHEPIAGLAVRLRDAGAMPIVHGHGSGNYFERSSDSGEVTYGHLQPGDYTVQVLGKLAAANQFVEYIPMPQRVPVHVDAVGPTNIEIPVPPRTLETDEIERRFPFYVYGRVTDEAGEPLADVEVRAATGVGTLMGGGRTRTDADGRYRLYFGPGLLVMNRETAPRGVGVQAALISAWQAGCYETNFNRQGALCMSDLSPEALEQEIKKKGRVWGHASLDAFVLPGRPQEVDFRLAPAATLEGTLVWGRRELKDQTLTLTGDELPPGSNVLRSVTTDRKGRFQLDCIPVGNAWRFAMRVQGTLHEIETQPFVIATPGVHEGKVELEATPADDGAVTLRLRFRELGQ